MLSKENDLHSIKIIDFGLSAQNFDKLINNDYCGTYIYMAPEQIEKKLYFISVDIWSIGILMFMLLNNGKHPFYVKGDNRKDFEKKIEECKINFYNKISPMGRHLILKLLEPNPSWRYNGAQAIKHPWITRNKEDEVPLTFNEILKKSNDKKILRDLLNICLFMNYFNKTEKKYNINKEYIDNCNYYNEKVKKKLIKKKEKCLDVLSTDEGEDEDSNDKTFMGNEYLGMKKEEEKIDILNSNIEQNSIIIPSNKPIKYLKNKKLNYVKSSKNISYLAKKFSTDKKLNSNFQKFKGKKVSSIASRLNLLPKSNNNQNNNAINYFQNNNPNNSVQIFNLNNKDNKESNNNNRQAKELNEVKFNKNNKISNFYYFERNIRNRLPHIVSPRKRKEFNFQEFSFHNMGNINIVPIVLPNIENIKKVKNNRYESIKKKIRKKSSHGKK